MERVASWRQEKNTGNMYHRGEFDALDSESDDLEYGDSEEDFEKEEVNLATVEKLLSNTAPLTGLEEVLKNIYHLDNDFSKYETFKTQKKQLLEQSKLLIKQNIQLREHLALISQSGYQDDIRDINIRNADDIREIDRLNDIIKQLNAKNNINYRDSFYRIYNIHKKMSDHVKDTRKKIVTTLQQLDIYYESLLNTLDELNTSTEFSLTLVSDDNIPSVNFATHHHSGSNPTYYPGTVPGLQIPIVDQISADPFNHEGVTTGLPYKKNSTRFLGSNVATVSLTEKNSNQQKQKKQSLGGSTNK